MSDLDPLRGVVGAVYLCKGRGDRFRSGFPRGEAQAAARVSRAAVLQFLRDGEMTSGEAAEALGLSRREVLQLMAEQEIPIANYDPSELEDELEALRRIAP